MGWILDQKKDISGKADKILVGSTVSCSILILISYGLCVCSPVHMCGHTGVHSAYGGQSMTPGIVPQVSSTCFVRQRFAVLSIAEMWNFLRRLGWLGSEPQRFDCFHLTSPGIISMWHMAFLCGFWWSNLRVQLTYLPSPSLSILRTGRHLQWRMVYKPKGNWEKCIWQLPGLLLRIYSLYKLIPKVILKFKHVQKSNFGQCHIKKFIFLWVMGTSPSLTIRWLKSTCILIFLSENSQLFRNLWNSALWVSYLDEEVLEKGDTSTLLEVILSGCQSDQLAFEPTVPT